MGLIDIVAAAVNLLLIVGVVKLIAKVHRETTDTSPRRSDGHYLVWAKGPHWSYWKCVNCGLDAGNEMSSPITRGRTCPNARH